MKTKRRRGITLGVESSFFPRARKAMEERQRAQGGAGESKKRDVWEFLREETPRPPTASSPAIPPIAPPVERPEMMRPGYQPSYSRVDPSQAFAVPEMWAYIDQLRRSPGYVPQVYLIDRLTPPVTGATEEEIQGETLNQIASFFGIPGSAFQGMTSIEQGWNQVIVPMFEEFEGMMNRGRPVWIPGFLRFDFSPQNELVIRYYDR
jgi:hypothetical protein